MTQITLVYSRRRAWIDELLAALAPGVLVIINDMTVETIRKRLYRRGVIARVSTNPGRGCVVRL